jgi:hypothetical protein
MHFLKELLGTSDVVRTALFNLVAGFINPIFWLLIFLTCVLVFRKQIAFLLESLARLQVGSAVFELRSPKATLEYYDIFSTVLVEILANPASSDIFYSYLSKPTVRKLARFLDQYIKNIPEDPDIEVLKNLAMIVGRGGYHSTAVRVCDALLARVPEDKDLLHTKARFLGESLVPKNLSESEAIYSDLLKRYPKDPVFWLRRAHSRVHLNRFDAALEDLKAAIEHGYWKNQYWHPKDHTWKIQDNMLDEPLLEPLDRAKPAEFKALRQLLSERISTAKQDAKKLLESGTPPHEVAHSLGVSVPTLYHWVLASSRT